VTGVTPASVRPADVRLRGVDGLRPAARRPCGVRRAVSVLAEQNPRRRGIRVIGAVKARHEREVDPAPREDREPGGDDCGADCGELGCPVPVGKLLRGAFGWQGHA